MPRSTSKLDITKPLFLRGLVTGATLLGEEPLAHVRENSAYPERGRYRAERRNQNCDIVWFDEFGDAVGERGAKVTFRVDQNPEHYLTTVEPDALAVGQIVTLRNGKGARVVATDLEVGRPVALFLVTDTAPEGFVYRVNRDGRYVPSGSDNELDVVSFSPPPPPLPKLPDLPSALIRVAVADLEKARGRGLRVDMGDWVSVHTGTCSVCLAGAVMVGTLGADTNAGMAPTDFPHEIKTHLRAIDRFRVGDMAGAYVWLGRDKPAAVPANFPVSHYSEDAPDAFFQSMLALATALEMVGE